jgi:hypothetical protein
MGNIILMNLRPTRVSRLAISPWSNDARIGPKPQTLTARLIFNIA